MTDTIAVKIVARGARKGSDEFGIAVRHAENVPEQIQNAYIDQAVAACDKYAAEHFIRPYELTVTRERLAVTVDADSGEITAEKPISTEKIRWEWRTFSFRTTRNLMEGKT